MPVISDAQIAQAAENGGFTNHTFKVRAVAIALAESGGNTDAFNPAHKSGTYGLWQISKSDHPDLWNDSWRDPNVNATMAFGVLRKQGWSAWSVYTSQRYRVFLNRARKAVGDEPTGPDLPDIPNPLDDFGPLIDAAKALSDPNTWKRVGLAVVGGILIIVALVRITGVRKAATRIAKSKVGL